MSAHQKLAEEVIRLRHALADMTRQRDDLAERLAASTEEANHNRQRMRAAQYAGTGPIN